MPNSEDNLENNVNKMHACQHVLFAAEQHHS